MSNKGCLALFSFIIFCFEEKYPVVFCNIVDPDQTPRKWLYKGSFYVWANNCVHDYLLHEHVSISHFAKFSLYRQ